MEVIPVIIFIIFVVIVFVNITNFVRGHGSWTKSFEQVATRYGGWYSAARTTRPPAATFKYKDAEVKVMCRRSSRPRGTQQTEFRIRWPEKSLKMEIVNHGERPRLRALRHAKPQPAEDEKFNARFDVYVGQNRKQMSHRLLSSGVRWQIFQLDAFLPSAPIQVLIDRGWLVVRQAGYIKESQQLDDYVRFCLELYDQLTLTMSEGIEFRDDVVVSGVDAVRCPICGSNIEGKMVICVRCKTPHCLDCWQYNVKCGMYACDETRYLVIGGDQDVFRSPA